MALIGINWRGYLYQDGINSIRLSYDSAAQALELQTERAYDEIRDYNTKVEAGDQSGVECDEEGYVVFDEADVLMYRSLAAEEALNTLRKAFAIVLYHHWERSVREWVQSKNGNHDTLVNSLAATGHFTDPLVNDLRTLVNTHPEQRLLRGLAGSAGSPEGHVIRQRHRYCPYGYTAWRRYRETLGDV